MPTEKETMLSRVLATRDLSEVGRRAGRGLWKGVEGLADVAEFAVQAGSPTSRVGDPTARDVGMGAFYQENLAKYLEPRIPPGNCSRFLFPNRLCRFLPWNHTTRHPWHYSFHTGL